MTERQHGGAPICGCDRRDVWRRATPWQIGGPLGTLAGEISARDNEIAGLGPLALLVGLDVERDAFPLGQRLEPGPLDRRDVNEYIAAAVVRLDEAVAPLGVEEFD